MKPLSTNDFSRGYLACHLYGKNNVAEFAARALSGDPKDIVWRTAIARDGRLNLPKATDRKYYNPKRHSRIVAFEEARQGIYSFLILNQEDFQDSAALQTELHDLLVNLYGIAGNLPSYTGGPKRHVIIERSLEQFFDGCERLLANTTHALDNQEIFFDLAKAAEQTYIAAKDKYQFTAEEKVFVEAFYREVMQKIQELPGPPAPKKRRRRKTPLDS